MNHPDIFNHLCSLCGQLRRTLHKFGWVWRICTTCDQPLGGSLVGSDDDDSGAAPEGAE